MKPKNFTEWVKFYNQKVLGYISDKLYISQKDTILYDPKYGFSIVHIENDTVKIKQTCGDGKHWERAAEKLAEKFNVSKLQTKTMRSIEPYIKAYGWTIITKNNNEYICKDTNGKKVVLTKGKTISFNGSPIYVVTKYMRS